MTRVNIFISSTCYDLSQVRQDLCDFISSLGHNPMMSEQNDFPIDPQLDNWENCINAVKKYADIFVLIIGNKYGSVGETGNSITNTEYLTAVQKGIPIYTFSLKQMTTLLPLWEKNPTADFSDVVDNNKIFEFLSEVRKKSGRWNFEFEKAQDIKDTLRKQLSFLFQSSLELRKRIVSSPYEDLFAKISSKALNIIMQKEEGYDMRFFMQSMHDEIKKNSDLKNDYKYSVLFKSLNKIDNMKDLADWLLLKMGQAQNYIASLNNLMEAFTFFYKEPGTPSDLEGLYYVACSYARSYASLLEWGIEVKSVIVPNKYKKLLATFAEIPNDAIQQIEEFPMNSLNLIEESKRRVKDGELKEGNVVNLHLVVSINDDVMQRYNKEFEVLKNKEMSNEGTL